MVIKDISVEATITLDILVTTFFDEYIDPTKYVRTALGIADCINNTPAGYPDKLKKEINKNAIAGPTKTLIKLKIIESFQDLTFSLVKAIPKDIRTKKIVA